MVSYEQKWLELIKVDLFSFTVVCGRYFCLFEDENQTLTFLDFLNSRYPNLSLTTEREHMKQLPFWMFSILVQTD